MHKVEVDILKRRSIEYLKEAKIALERGSYDVACFLAEQALQLHLKSALLKVVGDYPRTHSVRQLLGDFIKGTKAGEAEEFVKANRVRLSALEDAYLMARYFTKDYDKSDAEDMVKLADEATRLTSKIVDEQK